VGPALDAVCRKALAKKVEQRYATMADFGADLEDYVRRTAPAPAPPPEAAAERRVTCPNCGKRLRVPASAWGKKVKCPACAARVAVPGDLQTQPPSVAVPPREFPKKLALPPREMTNSLGMKFVLVPRGTFWMGGGGGKPGDQQDEIPHDFYLGIYP